MAKFLRCAFAVLLFLPAVAAPGARVYESRGGYSIIPPDGWEIQKGSFAPLDAIFSCKADPGVNISVTWADAKGEKGLSETAVAEMKEMFGATYPDFEITSEEWRTVGGARAYYLSARYSQMGVRLRNTQVMLIANQRFYTLTYTSTPALFMKHLGDFESAVRSFRISGGSATPLIKSPTPERRDS